MLQIPTFQTVSADSIQTIELNNQIVVLRITYNSRNEFFHLRFTDPDGVQLRGLKMVPDFPLMKRHQALINFSGDLILVKDDQSAGDIVTYENFGNGWNLYYFTEEEVEAWEVTNGL